MKTFLVLSHSADTSLRGSQSALVRQNVANLFDAETGRDTNKRGSWRNSLKVRHKGFSGNS